MHRYGLSDWHEAILERVAGSRFPIVTQTPKSIHFRRPSGVIEAHFCGGGRPALGPGTFADYLSASTDGHVYGEDMTYATARSTSVGTRDWAGYMYIGQTKAGPYGVYRGFLAFDTSGIPDDNVVTGVTMTLTPTDDYTTTDFDVVFTQCNWLSPISSNAEADFDAALAATAEANIWRNTSGISVGTQYTSGALDTAWVSKTGVTRYAVLSSRDIAGTTPTGQEQLGIACNEHATEAYRPMLSVTYGAASGNTFSRPAYWGRF